jgi:hypothetical protein
MPNIKFVPENLSVDSLMMFDVVNCVDTGLNQSWRFALTGSITMGM